ncbi:zinc finger protein 184 isoform X2 [Manduca sexta]|uniref:C2H2-type domain-containing protein n=2 Tax=Manduca sexta TaxID=7130 RepID=A0A921ZQU1_MANSE|nr:zinc finger protein 184 isoform X2 [Manduca sexta]XP_030034703.1 zinc finger protein 184 isoform X2 [Manduca sexta]XP_030034705.1 zinc finger protein 184 isoform X2 [Manduca sexta]XP_030034707.1 zinc finger protein 184 isoform X2 [Manduca sexta]XP_037293102.1 zinc finger protein 184 isoform X2 [Manduca sexta]XP_037293106.1 zinc finger protein 184 isoform X2 [Manduca sexta]XP_037293114.1 zinc finger protein 184 isoform X2 [Manduca sexta]XP_037293116.1 zinc finger protein 184 isoform X2 [Ma
MESTIEIQESQEIKTPSSKEAIQVEWLKQKLKCLWDSAPFCGMCLDNTRSLNSLDNEFVIGRQKESQSLLDILNYVFNEDIENIMSSTQLCDNCSEKTIQSYLFIRNTKLLSKIINNCVTDIHSKAVDVGEQILDNFMYDNANVMIVLENENEMFSEVENLTAITEIVPTDQPIIATAACPQHETKEDTKAKEIDETVIINKDKEEMQVKEGFHKPVTSERTPNITLEKGKLVIKPIKTLTPRSVPIYSTYKCNHCPDIFTTHKSLKEHEKSKHKFHVFQCRMCEKSYNTQQSLNNHYKTHSKARCKICRMILRQEDLFSHLREFHSNVVYPCKFCELVYYTQEALDTHFKANHLVNDTTAQSQCVMCLKEISEDQLKIHKCKFSCSDCFVMPCIHYNYLVSYRQQVLNHSAKVACTDCDYVTHRKEYFITHVNREHLDYHPFTCNDCGMQFYTKMSLKTHIDQYHIDNICAYCDTEFKKRNVLVEHRKKCKTIIRAFPCDKCQASFDLEEEIIKHEFLRHSDGGFACKLCNRRFLEEVQLEEHQVMAHSSVQCKKRRKNIECTLCDTKFNNIKELEQHEDMHGPNVTYPCKTCLKQFQSLKKLYIHQQRHYDRIQCGGCKKRIITSFYPQHAVRCMYVREGSMQHICEVCGKAFHLESLLRLHQKAHEKVNCSECGKLMKASNLENHLRGHSNIKSTRSIPKIACHLCGHLVRKKCDLDTHMNRYHLKVKPYSCHICNKRFCGKVRLTEHLATHTSDNECFCSICGKKFANRVCLKMHVRIHTGECPYTCDLCGDKFRSSSIMKTHRLKKHLEKSIACPACDSMFHIVREMRHHFKNVHWKDKDRPFNYKEAVSPEFYHLFEDGRLPKVDPGLKEDVMGS